MKKKILETNTNTEQSALRKAYSDMLLIRRFEEKAGQLYGMGMIGGFCHLYIGQEAVAVGIQHCLIPGDAVITSYRDHGVMLATGSDPKSAMAELLGRATGCSKGKGGSMHMFDLAKGYYGGHGIVGAQVPIGTGIAFAYKYRKEQFVAVTYFGDGAANQGQIYEAFNMAKLWQLPVLYVVENNGYGMGTSVARSCSTTDLYKRGTSFDIPGRQVDGMDFLAVREAVSEAVAKIRAGEGPILLEMKTYRYRGHSMSDPGRYRSKEEVEDYKQNHDPLTQLKNHLLNKKWADEDYFKNLEKEIKITINEVVEFAKNSPEPDVSELTTDIYV
jgi:pyruvate dehydrogenase E1 component alpha subunit